MKRYLSPGLFILVVITSPLTYAQGTRKPEALKCYQLGLEYSRQGKIEEAEEKFKKAVKIDRKFADAYNQLAVLYMNEGTFYGRIKAERELKKALELDFHNVKYNFNLALLYLKKGMSIGAQSQFKKVLKRDPQNSEAYFYLGTIKEQEMIKYKDMIDFFSGEGVIYFQGFAQNDGLEAIYYYSKAIALNPRLTRAYYRLSLIYYEARLLDKMVELLEQAVRINPEDKNCHLFLGLAYHKLKRDELALNQYEKAKTLMEPAERDVFESVELVMSPQQQDTYELAYHYERNKIEDSFWKSRDPFFMTEFNERILEHYSRVAYANLRFGFPWKGIEGWQTDRGKVYIRYGEPSGIIRTRPDLGGSKEFWSYKDFNFIFEDRFLTGNYYFAWGDTPETDYLYRYKTMIKETPDLYEHEFEGEKFTFPYDIVNFKGKEGGTLVEVSYGIPINNIHFLYRQNRWKALIDRGLFLFDEGWKDVFRNVEKKTLFQDMRAGMLADSFIVDQKSLQISPGLYHFALELKDNESGNVGIIHEEITVEAYDDSVLQMSDILLASEIVPLASEGNFRRADLKIVPNPLKSFLQSQPIYVYFEIYNLKMNEGGKTHFRIETSVRLMKEEKTGLRRAWKGLVKLIGLAKKQGEITTSYEYHGSSETESQYRVIQITEFQEGNFQLAVRVSDLNSKEVVEKNVAFRLVE